MGKKTKEHLLKFRSLFPQRILKKLTSYDPKLPKRRTGLEFEEKNLKFEPILGPKNPSKRRKFQLKFREFFPHFYKRLRLRFFSIQLEEGFDGKVLKTKNQKEWNLKDTKSPKLKFQQSFYFPNLRSLFKKSLMAFSNSSGEKLGK